MDPEKIFLEFLFVSPAAASEKGELKVELNIEKQLGWLRVY